MVRARQFQVLSRISNFGSIYEVQELLKSRKH